MTSSQASAVVPMEVLIEQHVILPVRIGLEFLRPAVNRPPPRFSSQKDSRQPIGNFSPYLKEVHQFARACWAFDLERVAVIQIELHQGSKQQYVHWHPYGPTPVGVPAEHASVRFGRKIVHSVFLATHIENIRMLGMEAGYCPYSVVAQEFFLIKHAR